MEEPTFQTIPGGTWFALADQTTFPWGPAHTVLVKLRSSAALDYGNLVNACGLCDGRLHAVPLDAKVLPIVVQTPTMAAKSNR